MLELQELRTYIEQGRYADALVVLGEMDEMSYDDKVNKIGSFAEILLLHLIKRQVEQRTTRSGDISIRNALDNIVDTNRRYKSSGYHVNHDALSHTVQRRFGRALRAASLEAFGGRYSPDELTAMVDATEIMEAALAMIIDAQAAEG